MLWVYWLSFSQSRGVISLIRKPGKGSDHLHTYCPIRLLNWYCKIAAKGLANRLKSVISSLIGLTHTGFVKNSFIGENIKCIMDLIHYTTEYNIPGFIVFIDFNWTHIGHNGVGFYSWMLKVFSIWHWF